MPVTVLPREEGFGTLIGRGLGSTLGEQLKDFQEKKKNRSFYENLATQLSMENPETFVKTFEGINPQQFGDFLYKARETSLPEKLGFGRPQMPQGMEETERKELLKQNFDDMIKSLRENIDVTEVGYGLKRFFKKGIPLGSFDPKIQEFKTAGDTAVVIAEELFREAQGRGLTQKQTDYVQNNFKVTPDMTTAQANAVINRLEKLYKGVLPKDAPKLENGEKKQKVSSEPVEKQDMQPLEKVEGLPDAKISKGLTYRDEETGKRYRSDGKKWTLVKG